MPGTKTPKRLPPILQPPLPPAKPEPRNSGRWQDHAACNGADTNLFFPHPSQHTETKQTIATWCRHCPVAKECLEDALKLETPRPGGRRQRDGIRGGLTPTQRAHIEKQRKKAS